LIADYKNITTGTEVIPFSYDGGLIFSVSFVRTATFPEFIHFVQKTPSVPMPSALFFLLIPFFLFYTLPIKHFLTKKTQEKEIICPFRRVVWLIL
jgi:hypothetical protein